MMSATGFLGERDHKWLLSARQEADLTGTDQLGANWSVDK